jgi:hypothetical protein
MKFVSHEHFDFLDISRAQNSSEVVAMQTQIEEMELGHTIALHANNEAWRNVVQKLTLRDAEENTIPMELMNLIDTSLTSDGGGSAICPLGTKMEPKSSVGQAQEEEGMIEISLSGGSAICPLGTKMEPKSSVGQAQEEEGMIEISLSGGSAICPLGTKMEPKSSVGQAQEEEGMIEISLSGSMTSSMAAASTSTPTNKNVEPGPLLDQAQEEEKGENTKKKGGKWLYFPKSDRKTRQNKD